MTIISNPAALQFIVIILAVISLLLVTYYRGVKIGEKKNGIISDANCDKKMDQHQKWFLTLEKKVDKVTKCVATVEGYLKGKEQL